MVERLALSTLITPAFLTIVFLVAEQAWFVVLNMVSSGRTEKFEFNTCSMGVGTQRHQVAAGEIMRCLQSFENEIISEIERNKAVHEFLPC